LLTSARKVVSAPESAEPEVSNPALKSVPKTERKISKEDEELHTLIEGVVMDDINGDPDDPAQHSTTS
jgi:hypothetical protein